MTSELEKKVIQLKNSFSVEGSLLIKSNRFTQDELDTLFNERGTTHPSHFNHLFKDRRIYTDDEISQQINTVLNQNVFEESDLNDKVHLLFMNSYFINIDEDKKRFVEDLYRLVGWNKLTPLYREFWAEFGSAPFDGGFSQNKKLLEFKSKYGACGMSDIFGDKFSKTYCYINIVNGSILNFDVKWKEQYDIIEKSNIKYTSSYNSIEELEENVTVKKIKSEAKKFYMDKTKDFDERIKVFNKHGESKDYIFNPINHDLKKIFDIYSENDIEKYRTIKSVYVIDDWIENLEDTRCKIDYSKNKYHPSVTTSKRNYIPSNESITRLKRYYIEKLFLEDVSKFEWDW